MSDATAQLSFVSQLLAITAAIALLLAAVGLYGVISYLAGAGGLFRALDRTP